MTDYRRYYITGGCFFFTVVLAERHTALLTRRITTLRDAFKEVMQAHPFTIDAIVVLPDHLHCIWQLPEGDSDYSSRWREIKKYVSRRIVANQANAIKEVWQPRFWEHRLRDEKDFNLHVDYIHYNPVKHGMVTRPVDWQHSSIHRYIRHKIIHSDWGSGSLILSDCIGHE